MTESERIAWLTDSQLAALYEVAREGPRTTERIALENALGRRVKAAGMIEIAGIRYVWDATDDSFVRRDPRRASRFDAEQKTPRRLGRLAIEGTTSTGLRGLRSHQAAESENRN